jgi:putative ABC transport system permease protein
MTKITPKKKPLFLSWLQLRKERARLIVAIAGISFADVLMFLQMGFRGALFSSAVEFHHSLNGEIVMTSSRSRSLISLDRFTDRRLYQAAGITGVASVSPIYLNSIQWRNPENKEIWDIYTIGINPEHQVLNIAGVEANREKLRQPDTVLFNLGSRREFSAIAERFQSGEAITTEINERQVQIQGLFKLSPTFGINAYLVTSDVNFLRMAPFRQGGLVDVGVIKLKPDADVQAVLAEMRLRLPDDVKVMTRDDYAKAEVAFWSASTPVGYTFDLGVVIAFIVGSVIVYQILYSDVTDHLPEYATLKAMGFRDRYLLIVVFQESLILAVLGFIPGTAIALGIYQITNLATMLPMAMDLGRIVFVFILTAIMSSVSAAIAVRKLQTADPADIFYELSMVTNLSKPAISIANLNHYYGQGSLKKQVLFDINLQINRGEIIIMTGPSGSGKTTLLTLMGSLRSIQEGNLSILGQELLDASKEQMTLARRNIGYIFQAHNLLNFLTAYQNIEMALEIQEVTAAEADTRIRTILNAVGLEHRMDYYPSDLSGGQKQRVAIARALVSQPKIILADEPTAALDKKSGRDVVEIMEKLAREQGCTILLVTHDNRILDLADRIIYMEDGYLVNRSDVAV